MLRPIDQWYLDKEEPARSCLQVLREYVLQLHPSINEAWKYRMPFFTINGKMFCYLWTDKKTGAPYIGIVEGNKINEPLLVQEKRARMKIFVIDPAKDLPMKDISRVMKKVLKLYLDKK